MAKKGKKGKKGSGQGTFFRGADQWFAANFGYLYGLSHKPVKKDEDKKGKP